MLAEKWERIKKIFEEASTLDARERRAFVEEASGGDTELVDEVWALLQADAEGARGLRTARMGTPPGTGRLREMDDSTEEDFRARLQAELGDGLELRDRIGRGGFGSVYVAWDVRLEREVAVKVLRHDLFPSPGQIARFEREARAIGGLRHKNILPLYSVGGGQSFVYMVMPRIRGESLGALMRRTGPLEEQSAVRIASAVLSALEASHGAGIIHRDVKPGNVLLEGPDQHVLLMDFGLAAPMERSGTEISQSGVVLGTPAYMSPEQATGDQLLDHRSDLYSVGCLLYAMLVGNPPFHFENAAAVLRGHLAMPPPPIRETRPDVAPGLEAVVLRALSKEPADRHPSAKAFADDLKESTSAFHPASAEVTPPPTTGAPVPPTLGRTGVWAWGGGLATLAGLAATTMLVLGARPDDPVRVTATTQLTRELGLEMDPAISPDGRFIAYAGGSPGRMGVFVREFAGGGATLVTDTAISHRWPQWSPDGTRLAIEADASVEVIGVLGGLQGSIAGAHSPAWSPGGEMLAYSSGDELHLYDFDARVSRFVVAGSQIHSLRWSPDGSRIAYVSGNSNRTYRVLSTLNTAPSTLWLTDPETGETIEIVDNGAANFSPIWQPDGSALLFVSNVRGQRDVFRLPLRRDGRPSGNPVPLTTGLRPDRIDLSSDGSKLVFSHYEQRGNLWKLPLHAGGTGPAGVGPRAVPEPVISGNEVIEASDVAANGWILFDSNRHGHQDVFRVTTPDGEAVRLTRDPADDFGPDWSPDLEHIAFYSTREGSRDLYVMTANGDSLQRVTDDPDQEYFPDWSPDGRSLLYWGLGVGYRGVFRVDRPTPNGPWSEPVLLVAGAESPRWSPDGAKMAYLVDGRVWVSDADGGRARELTEQVDERAAFLRWSIQGSEVVYKTVDEQFEARFWAHPAGGGAPRLLYDLSALGIRSDRPEFSVDSDYLYFVTNTFESDIWALELEGL